MRQINIKTLNRKRINKLLNNIYSYPLCVVRAPSGFGKTTAVRQYLKSKKVNTIWVSLSGSDGSRNYFWERMTTQLQKIHPALGQQLKSLGFPNDASERARIINILTEQEFTSPLVLVLDDFMSAEDPAMASLLRLIIQESVRNLHIVILTREMRNYVISEFYQKQLCFIISDSDLRFSSDEIKQYSALMDQHINDDDISKIHELTDGWISMVYLVIRRMQRGLPIGAHLEIDELLEKNLYDNLPDDGKQVLLFLSCIETFSIPMAVYVINDTSLTQKLDTAISGNPFILYDEFSRTYKIHNLLLDLLKRKAAINNINFNELNRRAGEWHLANRSILKAFEYFHRSGDIEKILAELNKRDTPSIPYLQFRQIREIFTEIPEELCFKYPIAYLQYIRIYALSGSKNEKKDCAEKLGRMEAFFHNTPFDTDYRNYILGEINIIWTFVVFNDLVKIVDHNQRAIDYFSGGSSAIVNRNKEMSFGSPHLLYIYYKEEGKFKHTAQYIFDHFHTLITASNGCGIGSEMVALAEYALETGDYEKVELNAYKAIYQTRSAEQYSLLICANFALARSLINKGKCQEAISIVNNLREEIVKENNPVLNTTFELCHAYIQCCLQRLDAIPNWIKKGEITSANYMYQGMGFNYLVYGKYLILAKEYQKFDALSETFNGHYTIFNNALGFIHNLINESIAKFNLLENEAGKESLLEALQRGQSDGIVMPFIENSPFLLEKYRELHNEKLIDGSYLETIIRAGEKYCSIIKEQALDEIDLTSREIEILHLLESGHQHKEIGDKLCISVATVRFHIKNIYRKLDVNNKVLAIQKARDKKII